MSSDPQEPIGLQTLIPIYIYPADFLVITRRRILLPGVSLLPLHEPLRNQIDERLKSMSVAINGGHNYGLLVDHEAYWRNLGTRTGRAGEKDFLVARDIAKLLIISIFLLRPIWFRIGGYFSGNNLIRGQKLVLSSYGHHDEETIPHYRRTTLFQSKVNPPIATKKLVELLTALEPYFRSDIVRIDRLGASIAHLWSSLCTPYKEQALLSVCCGLESLTSLGDKNEITHQMAERLAFLLTTDSVERHKVYRDAKKIYAMRSALVHGTYKSPGKKDVPMWDRLLISPKFLFAGNSDLRRGTQLLMSAINAFLSEGTLMQIIQKKSDDEALRDFFECRLFGQKIDNP